MNQHSKSLKRFHSLDVLRGIAALSLVLWHWQHFFSTGHDSAEIEIARLPLFEYVFFIYTKGWLGVDLFFSLSGFIFYWLYSKRIAEDTISPGRFSLLRFSRLYPLHFATLLVVAVGQLWLMNTSETYFVYSNNDTKHFLLNLFFASSWGFENGYSFNAPIWSVSVEVLLYALFFACCRLFRIRAIILALISITGFLVIQEIYSPIGRGIGSFFMGGCVFLAYRTVITSKHAMTLTRWTGHLMIGTWLGTITIIGLGMDLTSLFPHPTQFSEWSIQKILSLWPVMVLFPLTILSLALIETHRGSLGKRVSFIGDISYSSYLLHFPLQLVFSAVVIRYTSSVSIYYSPWFMALFFAILILTCFVSFRYFEVPIQIYLRRIGKT